MPTLDRFVEQAFGLYFRVLHKGNLAGENACSIKWLIPSAPASLWK
jgi:hypothetical protein